MDVSVVPWIWIIIVGVALAVAYKLGKDAGKLNKAKGREETREKSDDSDASTEEEGSSSDDETEEESRKGAKKTAKVKKKRPKEKRKSVTDDDWEWPVYDSWWSSKTQQIVRKARRKEEKDKKDSVPFEVTYKVKDSMTEEDETTIGVKVKLRSRDLIDQVRICMKKHSEKLVVDEPEINGQYLFIALNSFRDRFKSMQDPVDNTSLAKFQLKHLIRYLETEYKDTISQVERMRRNLTVSFDLLWAFFHRQERVYYTCGMTGQTLSGIVYHTSYDERRTKDEKFFHIQLKCYNYNGKYVKSLVDVDVHLFSSHRSFYSLGICPLSLLSDFEVARLDAKFLQNGRKFYDIVKRGSIYMEYRGPRLMMANDDRRDEQKINKEKADGRVMVDLVSFARMNPEIKLKEAEPRTTSSPQSTDMGLQPSDDELMLAPAIVFGFSFSVKNWGAFVVDGLSDVKFDDEAFDRLVLLDRSKKDLLLALVSQYLSPKDGDNAAPTLDPISNKGDGCIFLCYGPPGTGKTLTAESMAEKLGRPLWSMSVFELGRNPEDLERNLLRILDIALQWRAILLLDEADIYLERRTTSGDPDRAAMTAIFLRQLEYYRGVLFLTTNRVASFDDAFCSRISMFLRYHRLQGPQREAVWRNLFARAGIKSPDLTPFLDTQLNGREIRNTIRIAQMSAKSSGQELTTAHVLEVVHMHSEFIQDLEAAIKNDSFEQPIARALAKVRSMSQGVRVQQLPSTNEPQLYWDTNLSKTPTSEEIGKSI